MSACVDRRKRERRQIPADGLERHAEDFEEAGDLDLAATCRRMAERRRAVEDAEDAQERVPLEERWADEDDAEDGIVLLRAGGKDQMREAEL